MEIKEPRNTEPELTPSTENKTEPPVELDELQKKVRAYTEQQWNLYQRLGGAALGLLCGYLLTFFSSYPSIGMYGTIAAALIALFVPSMIEKRVKRTVQKGRIALMIGLGIWLLAYLAIMLIQGTPLLAST